MTSKYGIVAVDSDDLESDKHKPEESKESKSFSLASIQTHLVIESIFERRRNSKSLASKISINGESKFIRLLSYYIYMLAYRPVIHVGPIQPTTQHNFLFISAYQITVTDRNNILSTNSRTKN